MLEATLPTTEPVIEIVILETPEEIAARVTAEELAVNSPHEIALLTELNKAAQRARRYEEEQQVCIPGVIEAFKLPPNF